MSSADPDATKTIRQFFNLWEVYDRVLDHDYMAHNALYAEVGRVLAGHFGGRPFSVIDLGCGSGRHLFPVLAALPVKDYEGHDLSPVAIEHARRALVNAAHPVRLHAGDLRETFTAEGPLADVIFSGFTLHHLTTEERAEVLRRSERRLAPDGLVLWVDLLRMETETREQWLDAYCGVIEQEWRAIPPEGVAAINGHIRDCDQPGTLTEHGAAAVKAGLPETCEHLRIKWHTVWSCRRAE